MNQGRNVTSDQMNGLVAEDALLQRLDDLERSILDWLGPAAGRFDPLDWSDRQAVRIRRKAFDELSVCLYVLDALGDCEAPDALRRLVLDRVNDGRYHRLVCRNTDKFLLYAFPFAYAKTCGELDRSAEETVRRVLDERTVWSTERTPFRLVDLWHFCQLFDYDQDRYDLETVLQLSCLARPPDPVTASPVDVYALTHNVLFYHNFGVDHPSFPDGPTSYDLDASVTGLLLRSLAAENSDLVVELLAAGTAERVLSPTLIRLVVTWLVERVEDDGYVSGPTLENRPRPTSLDADQDPWLANYHTNLAVLIAIQIVRRAWSDLETEPGRTPDSVTDVEGFRQLGEVVHLLNEYDLAPAAKLLTEVSESPVVDRFPDVFEAAVDFLRRQRRPDGHYGFWTDEAALFLKSGGDRDTFRSELLHPTTEACNEALDAVGSPAEGPDKKEGGSNETD